MSRTNAINPHASARLLQAMQPIPTRLPREDEVLPRWGSRDHGCVVASMHRADTRVIRDTHLSLFAPPKRIRSATLWSILKHDSTGIPENGAIAPDVGSHLTSQAGHGWRHLWATKPMVRRRTWDRARRTGAQAPRVRGQTASSPRSPRSARSAG
jgi:hypothetical protein